jgi:hypothetical protein
VTRERIRGPVIRDEVAFIEKLSPAMICLAPCAIYWGLSQYKETGMPAKAHPFNAENACRK